MRTTDLVQRLQVARQELALESAIAKLDKYHLLVLDDLAYVSKDQAETSVLFELIAARVAAKRASGTTNAAQCSSRPISRSVNGARSFPIRRRVEHAFGMMTLAAIVLEARLRHDRLVHHATILEMNVESYRRKTAIERKRGRGRPAKKATIKSSSD